MKKLRVGLIGLGFIGVAHASAIHKTGCAELVGVATGRRETLRQRADALHVQEIYGSAEEMIADARIDVIHNCTPNHLHHDINALAIRSGKHVFSEKPLACSTQEAKSLLMLLEEYPDVVAGVNFNYRMNVLVQDMKHRVAAGELGKIRLIHGSYLQDWLFYDTDYDWRLEKQYAGESRAVADVGSHWMDLAQTVTGSKIVEVFADLKTLLPMRKRPIQDETTGETRYEEYPVTTEDYAAVMLRFDDGAAGLFHVSQVTAGRKCHLDISVDGDKQTFYWNQEEADRMWIGHRDRHNELVIRNPQLLMPQSRAYTYMPAGHPDGWNDATYNNIRAFYDYILQGKKHKSDLCDFATFGDGHYICKLTDAILKSNAEKRWISID